VSGDRLIEDVLVRRALQARESGETVLELPGIGPALAFSESGGGPVATLLFGLDVDASDLARSGLVVPLFHRVVERLAGPAPGVAEGTAGYPLDVDLATTPVGRVDLIAPDGTATTISTAAASATIEDTDVAGIYRLESGGGTVAMAAIGIDRGESSLAAAEVSEIQEWFAGLPVTFIGEGEAVADAVLMARRGRELWRLFLYAALALLAIEMVIARPRNA